MKNSQELTKDVQDALQWEPLLNTAEIGVTARDGIITLTGTVDTYLKKTKAEDTARDITGVKAVVEKIEVKYNNTDQKTDNDIASEVLKALKADWQVPDELVKVKVEDGWVTLAGKFTWNYQREAAQKAVRHLPGVKVLSNNITIEPEMPNAIEQAAIEGAINRSATLREARIHVNVLGDNVRLTGVVGSHREKAEAERMAWNAPGVKAVENEIAINESA